MASDLSGEVLDGRYEVVERMAEGAMGVVYRGVRMNLNRAVAIKIMHAALPGAMAARERFEREAKLMALLEHPHCVSVIDFGLHQDKPYVVMELVRGRSLYDLIVEQGRFEIPRAADIVRQVLSGLAHAHEQGIIHRDVKPANIMITPKAPLGVHARILDFGLARLCASSTSLTSGMAVGTPSYMAPEQCRGDQLDERVDIYACGVVLFELLAGRKPFVADDPIMIIKQQMSAPPPRLADIARADFGKLEGVVARALAKRPEDRYASAIAMSEAIDAALGGRDTGEPTSQFHDAELVEEGARGHAVRNGNGANGAPKGVSTTVLAPASADIAATRPTPPPHPALIRGGHAPGPSPSSSIDVPITVDSAVGSATADASAPHAIDPTPSEAIKTGVHDPHDASKLRRMIPISRLRWVVLGSLVLIGASSYVIYTQLVAEDEPAEQRAAAPVPADAPAIEIDDASTHPAEAAAAFEAGRKDFAKLWWADGIKSFKRAIELDPSYREDAALLNAAVQGFVTTPSYDDRLGGFLVWLGAPAIPYLDDVARNDRNPIVRTRCAQLLRRVH